jgi:hypothetical protein
MHVAILCTSHPSYWMYLHACAGAGEIKEGYAEGQIRGAKKYVRKTLMPTSEQLKSLPLRAGANTIRFYGEQNTLSESIICVS